MCAALAVHVPLSLLAVDGVWYSSMSQCEPDSDTPFCTPPLPSSGGPKDVKYAVVLIGVPHNLDQYVPALACPFKTRLIQRQLLNCFT
jgi:hypothetical protein